MNNVLSGRKALITGASRGIGRATALRLARSGAEIAVNFVSNESAAREVAAEIQSMGGNAFLIKADVSEEEDIDQMMGVIRDRWGSLDILISNAAGGGFRTLDAATSRNFDAAMHTNVRSLMLLVQRAAPLMKGTPSHGKVVAITSHGSDRALPHYAIIGASKAAIEAMIRHMALEYGPQGINFNCVLAGFVATDSTMSFPGADQVHRDANARMLVRAGETLLPEHVAETVHFLATPASDLIQGQVITIDGGAALQM